MRQQAAPPASSAVPGSILNDQLPLFTDDDANLDTSFAGDDGLQLDPAKLDEAPEGGAVLPGDVETDNDDENEEVVEEDLDDDVAETDVSPDPTWRLLQDILEMEDPEGGFEVVEREPEPGVAGPGPSTLRNRLERMLGAKRRYLDDDEADLVQEEYPGAATVIRMSSSLRQRWRDLFGEQAPTDVTMDGSNGVDAEGANLYAPFASKLDWEVVKWMVKDGIGHSSFDRLLSIEGVSILFMSGEFDLLINLVGSRKAGIVL